MLARIVQQTDDVMIVERIERHAAGPPDTDESRGPEQPQLVRDGRPGQAHECRQVADAPLAIRQRINQADPRGIAEQLEDVRDSLDRSPAKQTGLDVRKRGWIGGVRLRADEIGLSLGGSMPLCSSHNY